MSTLHCNECGTNFSSDQNVCPTCGCPKEQCAETDEAQPAPAEAEAAVPQATDEQNFNESYPYSPFSKNSWFKRTPWPLSKYPRREFAKRHPFLGWLLDPWHLTCAHPSEQEQYDIANNIFYLFNLIFKTHFYAFWWAFFKMWWSIFLVAAVTIAVIAVMCIIHGTNFALGGSWIGDTFFDGVDYALSCTPYYLAVWASPLIFTVLLIAFIIHYWWGMSHALHRYWPSFHRTWRRLNKRYWKDMKE